LGKAHLMGRINSVGAETQVNLLPHSEWTLNNNSVVGNLFLAPNSQITLNSLYDEMSSTYKGWVKFNQLVVDGQLTGNGHFRFLTNVAENRGDNVVINGLASGNYLLSLKNTGEEPKNVTPLSLVKLNHPNQHRQNAHFALENGFVDLGAYRYILANFNNDYRLYNPLRDAELHFGSNPELVANSQREFNVVHQALADKENELVRLRSSLTKAEGLNKIDRNRAARLLEDMHNTTNSYNQANSEYNRTARIRFIKRGELYKQFTQLKVLLERQRNEYRSLSEQETRSQQAVQKLLNLVNQAKTDLHSLESRQDNVLKEMNRLQAGLSSSIARAQQICEAQNLSSDICRKVAKVANEGNVTLFEEEIDASIERIELAQQALANAQGNQGETDIAQSSLNEAVLALLDSLNKAYQTEQEIQHFLSTQSGTVSIPVQSQLISRYSNTALSELSANVNGALQIGRNLDRHLLSQDPSNVWVNTESTKQTYRSDYYRPYKQTITLTQIGVAQDVTDNVKIGAILSDSRANNEFDENVSGKNRLTSVNAFVKGNWDNGIFASMDLGYGRSRNTVKFDGVDNVFHRNIFNVGGNLGASWDLSGWMNVQPSVGVRYYRLSGANYNLSEAKIDSKALHLTAYRVGIKLDKTFDINDMKVIPSFTTNYYDATQRKLAIDGALSVNDVAMKQQFGRYFTHELGLSAQFNQWNFSTYLGMLKGSDVAPQKFGVVKVGFSW
jgi:S6 family igA-specific metalloendopeptidase